MGGGEEGGEEGEITRVGEYGSMKTTRVGK